MELYDYIKYKKVESDDIDRPYYNFYLTNGIGVIPFKPSFSKYYGVLISLIEKGLIEELGK